MQEDENYFIEVKTSFTDKIANKTPNEISLDYSYMDLTEHLMFVSEVFNTLEISLQGEGMEVAAGAGVFATTLCRIYPAIKKMYALEIVSDVVNKLQPKIIAATGMEERVIPMVGDFNNIPLPDQSLDFVVGFSSLHHSNNLPQTLKEIGRILKPGGKLIFFDRANPNSMTKKQEHFLLQKEYSREYKIEHGLDPEIPYRRYQEGEHEPRFKDWYKAIDGSGISFESINTFSLRTFNRFLKSLGAYIPYFIRSMTGKMQYLVESRKLALFYVFPWTGKIWGQKIYQLKTKFKTGPMNTMMRHMVFVATKH